MHDPKESYIPFLLRMRLTRWNWRSFITSWIVFVGLGLLVIGVHRIQTQRIADSLLRQSKRAKSTGDWKEALQCLNQYLRFRGDDLAGVIELANWYDECPEGLVPPELVIQTQRDAILRAEATRHARSCLPELRQSLIRNCVKLDRYDVAIDPVLDMAIENRDSDWVRDLALCRYYLMSRGQPDPISSLSKSAIPERLSAIEAMSPVDFLAEAWSQYPGEPNIVKALTDAFLDHPDMRAASKFAELSQLERNSQLQDWIQTSLRKHPNDILPWQLHLSIASRLGPHPSDTQLAEALQRFPEDSSILLLVGRLLWRPNGSTGSAADENETPSDPSRLVRDKVLPMMRSQVATHRSQSGAFYAVLGDLALADQAPTEALACWRDGIRYASRPRAFLYLRCLRMLIEEQRYTDAFEFMQPLDREVMSDADHLSSEDYQRLRLDANYVQLSYYTAIQDYVTVSGLLDAMASTQQAPSATKAETFAAVGNAEMTNGRWERAGQAFDQACSILPANDELHRAAAEAWFRAGRSERAAQHLDAIQTKSQQDWLRLATMHLNQQLLHTAASWRWKAFDEALSWAKESTAASSESAVPEWRLVLLQWEAYAERADAKDTLAAVELASNALIDTCRSFPMEESLWLQVMHVLSRWGQHDLLESMRLDFQRHHTQSSFAIRERAEQLAELNRPDEAMDMLMAQLHRDPENSSLLDAWIKLLENADNRDGAWDSISEWCGTTLSRWLRLSHRLLASMHYLHRLDAPPPPARGPALQTKLSLLDGLENSIRAIEGDNGTEWKLVRGRRLLIQSDLDRTMPIFEAQSIAKSLQTLRPAWPPGYALEGFLANREGNYRAALRAFEKAIELGDHSWEAYERLLDGLYREGMIDQASDWVQRLRVQYHLSNRISSIAIRLGMRSGDSWLDIAEKGIKFRPNDPMAWLWYARALESTSRAQTSPKDTDLAIRIDAALERAMELEPETRWSAHFAAFEIYASRDNRAALADMLKQLRSDEARSHENRGAESSRLMLIGLLEQELGHWDKAEDTYQQSLKHGASPLGIGLQLGRLQLLRGDVRAAIETMEELLVKYPNELDLRSSLCAVLAMRGSHRDWLRIEMLLTDPDRANTPADRRLLARLWIQRAEGDDLHRAERIVDGLLLDPSIASEDDLFLQAMIHLQLHAASLRPNTTSSDSHSPNQHRERAKDGLRRLANAESAKPLYLSAYIDLLLQDGDTSAAGLVLEKLRSLTPHSADTMLASARVLHWSGETQRAIDSIRYWLDSQSNGTSEPPLAKTANLKYRTQAANAFWTIHAWSDADRVTQELMKEEPEFGYRLLTLLAESDDAVIRERSLEQILALAQSDFHRSIAFLILKLLTRFRYSEPLEAHAEQLLDSFVQDQPQDGEFRLYYADRWIAKLNHHRAVQLLREASSLQPQNAFAANNLATLLSEQPETRSEALVVIERIIQTVGPLPFLLDTQGTLLMLNGQPDLAAAVLENAAKKSADPRFRFHWYLALSRQGNSDAAARVLQSIDLASLRKTRLSEDDQQELDRLTPAPKESPTSTHPQR